MINANKSRIRVSGRLIFPMAGIILSLTLSVFSQSKSGDGTNDALSPVSATKRDPFWPVGHVPQTLKTVSAEPETKAKAIQANDWNGAMKKVVINGVSSRSDNEFFAVINGKVKSVNETISISHGGVTYTWAVASIKPPGSVKLRRVSAK